jgi:hypothetical protein
MSRLFGTHTLFGPLPTLCDEGRDAALYFDATSVLLDRLQRSARVSDGDLTIDRATLARAPYVTR